MYPYHQRKPYVDPLIVEVFSGSVHPKKHEQWAKLETWLGEINEITSILIWEDKKGIFQYELGFIDSIPGWIEQIKKKNPGCRIEEHPLYVEPGLGLVEYNRMYELMKMTKGDPMIGLVALAKDVIEKLYRTHNTDIAIVFGAHDSHENSKKTRMNNRTRFQHNIRNLMLAKRNVFSQLSFLYAFEYIENVQRIPMKERMYEKFFLPLLEVGRIRETWFDYSWVVDDDGDNERLFCEKSKHIKVFDLPDTFGTLTDPVAIRNAVEQAVKATVPTM